MRTIKKIRSTTKDKKTGIKLKGDVKMKLKELAEKISNAGIIITKIFLALVWILFISGCVAVLL